MRRQRPRTGLLPSCAVVLATAVMLALPAIGILIVTATAPSAVTANALPAARGGVVPTVTLDDPAADDQDDLCVWVHPTDRELSALITSDKAAEKLFVYGLDGATLQVMDLPGRPGNIDIRYGFPYDGIPTDLVAYNDRDHDLLVLLAMNPATRQLTRIDHADLGIGANYGVCLYRSPGDGAFYAYVTSKTGWVSQYRLTDAGGVPTMTGVRSWDIGSQTESCVCDDETAQVYFGEEDDGIWKLGAEPADPTAGVLIAGVGDASGLTDDVEGLTLYYAGAGNGYLIASSQGSSDYKVYDRVPPHAFITSFTVVGATNTDGIDVANVAFGAAFPFGLFACHNDNGTPKTVEVCRWEDVGLTVDTTSWDPRGGTVTLVPERTRSSWGRSKSRFR